MESLFARRRTHRRLFVRLLLLAASVPFVAVLILVVALGIGQQRLSVAARDDAAALRRLIARQVPAGSPGYAVRSFSSSAALRAYCADHALALTTPVTDVATLHTAPDDQFSRYTPPPGGSVLYLQLDGTDLSVTVEAVFYLDAHQRLTRADVGGGYVYL